MTTLWNTESMLAQTASTLNSTVDDFLQRNLPTRRLSCLTGLLLRAGAWCEDEYLADRLCQRLLQTRRPDGGWVDCEDTAWSLFALKSLINQEQAGSLSKSHAWLFSERSGVAWGYARRDDPNIPICSQIRICIDLPQEDPSGEWLRKAWEQDIHAKYQLSYKGAWYLLARGDTEADRELALQTIAHLVQDQRDDGGWGPWRNHAAPNDYFSTGIALTALGQEPLTKDSLGQEIFNRALEWAKKTCLPNGLFPTHYIELNSAWMLNGLSICLSRWN